MTLNPQYDTLAKTFVQQFYSMFDDPARRATLASFYKDDASMMTFEGEQFFGSPKIMQKIQSLTFQKIAHSITAVDAQPMFDGGILISVLGQLKTDEDPPHSFNQVFVLKSQPEIGSFYVAHDIFRLSLHSM
ncbi:probable nuclear transport factor 2 [Caerostris darwini]|uniref:NTF2-related export protein n=2 Tax=Caerostris TaxID=172845 RepID=A0AAV4UUR4_9ARAC|nr:probable nuclear transport factor 2 [Caerostris extrusa]GIY61498.1 probable nuclear transport factor 2 [Caerostris darwini]